MDNRPNTIAIDGPAASGKSTVGQRVAEELGFLYFDTGALYRAVTCLALEQGVHLDDEAALARLAEDTQIELEPPRPEQDDGRQYSVYANGEDITWKIRHYLVDKNVSKVAAYPLVRQALAHQQRRIGLRGDVVMVGRDIGTVVMYDAPLKIYLDASPEERARRRFEEQRRRNVPVEYESLLADLRARDHYDAGRETAPLRPAEDAHLVNSSGLSVDEVVSLVVQLAREHLVPETSTSTRE